jgi:hypothetical protein
MSRKIQRQVMKSIHRKNKMLGVHLDQTLGVFMDKWDEEIIEPLLNLLRALDAGNDETIYHWQKYFEEKLKNRLLGNVEEAAAAPLEELSTAAT